MSNTPASVVYIDDEEELCYLFRRIYQSPNYDIETFSDPQQALEYLQGHEVSIVFCDFRMPKMDAVQLHEGMPEKMKRNVPFYIVTGFTSAANFEIPETIDGVISKPINSSRIRAMLGELLV